MHRVLVFTLVVALSSIGIPLPAHAAEGEPPYPRALAFNGRPLSELLHARATGASVPVPALRQQADGNISGQVLDEYGQPFADRQVELQRPASAGRLRIVETTDTNGQFVYRRLGPGRHEVEVRTDGRVIATSGPIELSEGRMEVSGVTVALPPPPVPMPSSLPSASADTLLGGQPVRRAFGELQSLLEPGRDVIVRDEAGRKTRGRVSSISGDQVTIIQRRRPYPRFFRAASFEEHTFRAEAVSRIDVPDTPMEGALLGGAVGGIVLGLWARACKTGECIQGRALYAVLGTALSVSVGGWIDAVRNKAIYERPSQTPQVTVAPLLERDRKGVSARVSF